MLQPFIALGLPPLVEALGTAIILALKAGLGIALFVFLFYVIISIPEDSGYMTGRVLADNAMHQIGMHGGAVGPLTWRSGATSAIMSVQLRSRRERIIASFLVRWFPVRRGPSSSPASWLRSSVSGRRSACTSSLLIIITGLFLSRVTPGEQFGMIMGWSLTRPDPKLVARKAWARLSSSSS